MTQRGFTLLELLVVVAIMGILGTASIGGYRAMQRGMEEQGVKTDVNTFLQAAYQRAQIDRQPVAVYYWNETLRADSDDDNAIVIGKAVAVRRHGRITRVANGRLFDEFGDLAANAVASPADSSNVGSGSYLYKLNGDESSPRKTLVQKTTLAISLGDNLVQPKTVLQSEANNLETINYEADEQVDILTYAYLPVSGGDSNADWAPGDAYGFEFANIELPHNYLLGSEYSSSVGSKEKNAKLILFKPSDGDSQPTLNNLIQIYALRPGKSGSLESQEVK